MRAAIVILLLSACAADDDQQAAPAVPPHCDLDVPADACAADGLCEWQGAECCNPPAPGVQLNARCVKPCDPIAEKNCQR